MTTGVNRNFEGKAGGYIATQQVCFVIQRAGAGPLQLGVSISLIRQVVPFQRATRVPLAPDAILGIFDWRGRIVPVVDISWFLGHGKTPHSPRNRLLVLQRQDDMVAFLVSQVIGIVRTVGSVGPVPPEANLDPTVVRGSIRSTLGQVILLDAEAVF